MSAETMRRAADWLDVTAEHVLSHDCAWALDGCPEEHAALAVARAYLGSDS